MYVNNFHTSNKIYPWVGDSSVRFLCRYCPYFLIFRQSGSYKETYGMEPQANASAPTTYAFDPVSDTVLQSLSQIHKSHQKLRPVVDFNSSLVTQQCQDNRAEVAGGLSYDQFLAGRYDKPHPSTHQSPPPHTNPTLQTIHTRL